MGKRLEDDDYISPDEIQEFGYPRHKTMSEAIAAQQEQARLLAETTNKEIEEELKHHSIQEEKEWAVRAKKEYLYRTQANDEMEEPTIQKFKEVPLPKKDDEDDEEDEEDVSDDDDEEDDDDEDDSGSGFNPLGLMMKATGIGVMLMVGYMVITEVSKTLPSGSENTGSNMTSSFAGTFELLGGTFGKFFPIIVMIPFVIIVLGIFGNLFKPSRY